MADDRITIDPEFAPRPSKEPFKGWAWLITAAVGVAAFVLGSLLGSPAPVEPAEIDSAATATTASDIEAPSTGTTIDSVVSTIPRASSIREMVLLPMPLSEAVPGFTDTVVLLETPNPGLYVHRWRASERRTELALFVPRGGDWWMGRLNASGTFFARVSSGGSLIVTEVPDTGMDPSESEWEGLDVEGAWWHETRPGALVFLSCPPSQPGVATFHSLEVSDPASRPLPLASVDQGCGNEEQNVWVERWDNEGVWIGQPAPGDDTRIFIAADGSETAVDSGLPGTTETFQVDGEWEEVSYSPDGTLVVLVGYDGPYSATGTSRVVSSKSGEVVAEMTEPGSEVFAPTWSTDGRFLIFEQRNHDTGTSRLVFYDTATNSTTTIPILDVLDEIRTAPVS